MADEWRPVLNGRYWVTADGRVCDRDGQQIEPDTDDVGRQVVTLVCDGETRTGPVRELVMAAFKPQTERALKMNKLGIPAGDYAPAPPRWMRDSDLDGPKDLAAPTVIGLTRPTTFDLTRLPIPWRNTP